MKEDPGTSILIMKGEQIPLQVILYRYLALVIFLPRDLT
jgi:hypothetical protein